MLVRHGDMMLGTQVAYAKLIGERGLMLEAEKIALS